MFRTQCGLKGTELISIVFLFFAFYYDIASVDRKCKILVYSNVIQERIEWSFKCCCKNSTSKDTIMSLSKCGYQLFVYLFIYWIQWPYTLRWRIYMTYFMYFSFIFLHIYLFWCSLLYTLPLFCVCVDAIPTVSLLWLFWTGLIFICLVSLVFQSFFIYSILLRNLIAVAVTPLFL